MAKVADINFTYNQGELISLLQSRGVAIKKHDDKKEKESNEKIEKLIQDGMETEAFMNPVAAFVTFETEQAYNAMCGGSL